MPATSGLDLLEQAFGLLRRLPATAWITYFSGTGLFCLAFLFFWEEMTHSSAAAERVGIESLLLGVLLLVMFAAQASFSLRLRQLLEPGEALDRPGLLLLQCLVQPTKLLILPAAALAILPFAAVAAFYQHFAVLRARDAVSWRVAFRQARRLSQRGIWQTWIALALFALFGLLVWVNLFTLLALLPMLGRMFLGVESEFTRAGTNLIFTTTFFRISLALTYCVLEPLWRAAQVLRSFEGESVTTGADLRRALAAAMLFLCFAVHINAETPLPARQLDQAITQTLESRDFAWRTPKVAQKPRVPGWLEALQDGTRSLFRAINRGARSFFDWLDSLVDRNLKLPQEKDAPATGLRASSYLVIAFCVLLILGLIFRQWRSNLAPITQAAVITPAAVELTDESVLPTDRPEDEWTLLGRDLLAKGETRLALRALYLGCLAHLAQQQWILVHRGKSNFDYLRELRRRAKGLTQVEASFTDNLRMYERTWYGEHPATPEAVAEFLANFERIKSHA
ncbi:MAG: DUF4129 domain-containing protein [Bryobacteraceae bacterium]|nr:DUF4129 domain-containing protein [Bryobacteraceae bacterium]